MRKHVQNCNAMRYIKKFNLFQKFRNCFFRFNIQTRKPTFSAFYICEQSVEKKLQFWFECWLYEKVHWLSMPSGTITFVHFTELQWVARSHQFILFFSRNKIRNYFHLTLPLRVWFVFYGGVKKHLEFIRNVFCS